MKRVQLWPWQGKGQTQDQKKNANMNNKSPASAVTASLHPSTRGMANLKPNPMFDLQRVLEGYPQYDPNTTPEGVIDISSADNALMQEDMKELFHRYDGAKMAEESFDYGATAGSPGLLSAISTYINSHYKPSIAVQPSEIIATNGLSSLFNILAFNLCDPGEGVMFAAPNYGMFKSDMTQQNEIQIVEVPTEGIQDRFAACYADQLIHCYEVAYATALTQGCTVKALLICNPCNPIGRCYSRTTLVKMAEFCQRRNLHLISDEIYGMSGLPTGVQRKSKHGIVMDDFTSVLNLSAEDGVQIENIHCLAGASKDFGAGGLRLGYLITRNQLLWLTVRRLATYTWVTSYTDMFFTRFFSDTPAVNSFIDTYRQRLLSSWTQATDFLDKYDIPYDSGNAGFFLWIDLSKWLKYLPRTEIKASPEMRLTYFLMDRGVYLQPGEAFFSSVAGKYRLVYATNTNKALDIAYNRLIDALRELEQTQQVDSSDDASSVWSDEFAEKGRLPEHAPRRRSKFGCFS